MLWTGERKTVHQLLAYKSKVENVLDLHVIDGTSRGCHEEMFGCDSFFCHSFAERCHVRGSQDETLSLNKGTVG